MLPSCNLGGRKEHMGSALCSMWVPGAAGCGAGRKAREWELHSIPRWTAAVTAGMIQARVDHAAHLFCWQATASADQLRAQSCGAGRLRLHRGAVSVGQQPDK